MRRAGAQEHLPGTLERIRTATPQIAGDRLAGVIWQRQRLPARSLSWARCVSIAKSRHLVTPA
jgi:hypothetical protein